MIKKKYFI